MVKRGQVVVYHDLASAPLTTTDARAIRYCLDQQVRFYVGVPLRMPDQCIIGTLCLVGQQPREFSAAEQALLKAIASLASQAIVARHHCRSTPALGAARWQAMQVQARDELHALSALVRYLGARYGASIPVPEEILDPVWRRLHDLRAIVEEY